MDDPALPPLPGCRARIDCTAMAPVREFRARPIGHHSPALTAMLSVLRAGDVAGKYCLVCVRPHAQWAIARLTGRRGEPPVVTENRVFDSIEAAEWAVFKLRWEQECSCRLDEDAL